MEEFHTISCVRCCAVRPLTLDIISTSSCTWQALAGYDCARAVRTWNSGSSVPGCFWTNFPTFSCECELGFLRLIHVLLSEVIFTSCSMEKCAWSMLRLRGLPELVALGIGTLFHQPRASDRHVAAVSGSHEKSSFPVFDTGGEVARSPAVLTPRRPATNWSQ